MQAQKPLPLGISLHTDSVQYMGSGCIVHAKMLHNYVTVMDMAITLGSTNSYRTKSIFTWFAVEKILWLGKINDISADVNQVIFSIRLHIKVTIFCYTRDVWQKQRGSSHIASSPPSHS